MCLFLVWPAGFAAVYIRVLWLLPDWRYAECGLASRVCSCVCVLCVVALPCPAIYQVRSRRQGLLLCPCVVALLCRRSTKCGLAGRVCCCVRVLWLSLTGILPSVVWLAGFAAVYVLWLLPDRRFIKLLYIIISLSFSCRKINIFLNPRHGDRRTLFSNFY